MWRASFVPFADQTRPFQPFLWVVFALYLFSLVSLRVATCAACCCPWAAPPCSLHGRYLFLARVARLNMLPACRRSLAAAPRLGECPRCRALFLLLPARLSRLLPARARGAVRFAPPMPPFFFGFFFFFFVPRAPVLACCRGAEARTGHRGRLKPRVDLLPCASCSAWDTLGGAVTGHCSSTRMLELGQDVGEGHRGDAAGDQWRKAPCSSSAIKWPRTVALCGHQRWLIACAPVVGALPTTRPAPDA